MNFFNKYDLVKVLDPAEYEDNYYEFFSQTGGYSKDMLETFKTEGYVINTQFLPLNRQIIKVQTIDGKVITIHDTADVDLICRNTLTENKTVYL